MEKIKRKATPEKVIASKKIKRQAAKRSSIKRAAKAVVASSKNRRITIVKRAGADTKVHQVVLPLGNGWIVKSSDAKNFIVITDSKSEAISIARNLAKTKRTGFIVYGKTGN